MPSGLSLSTFLTPLISGVGSAVVGSLFGGSKQGAAPAPPPPPVEAPTVMPVTDDKAAQDAKRRSITAQIQRRGRASTILTGLESDSMAG